MGKTYGHLRAQIGALSELTKKLFSKKTWLIHVHYNEQRKALHSMPEVIAGWWFNASQ